MKKIFIIVTAAALLSSCKKNNDTTPAPQAPPPQIATIKQTISNGNAYDAAREFVYDDAKRLKEVKYTGANGGNINEKYTYNGNQVQYRYYIAGAEAPSAAGDYTLNAKGLAEKVVNSYNNTTYLFEYNAAGYLARINYVRNGTGQGYELYHYSDNNILDSISGFFADGTKSLVHVFTYEAGKKNTIGDENKGLQMLGKDPSAPVKKRTLFTYAYPGMTGVRLKYFEYDYTYEYDAGGRIKKHSNIMTQYGWPGGTSQSYTKEVMEYTYKQ